MSDKEAQKQVNQLLSILADDLDVSEAKYKEAEERYKALGKWLERPESSLRQLSPTIYVQGSFLFGTAIKPITDQGHYDLDVVCQIGLNKKQVTPKRLKEMVGREVKAYATAQSMDNPAEEGNRCWTLNYSDKSRFHMDVLPSVPDSEALRLRLEQYSMSSGWTEDAISITDRNDPLYEIRFADHLVSNPKGYAEWFKDKMKKIALATFSASDVLMEKYAKVEDVPTYEFKSPLQRVVQILKRHRDITFGDSDDKPISIVITTLVAHAYQGESDIQEALANIVDRMLDKIEMVGCEVWIRNPVNPVENFADKWREHPSRKQAFYRWHQELKSTIGAMNMSSVGLQAFSANLEKLVGKAMSESVMKKYAEASRSNINSGNLKVAPKLATFGSFGASVKPHTFYGK